MEDGAQEEVWGACLQVGGSGDSARSGGARGRAPTGLWVKPQS